MIVCRRPFRLYDVDILGLAGVAALAGLAIWLLVFPWQETWEGYQGLASKRTVARQQLDSAILQLESYERGVAELERVLAAQIEVAPSASVFSAMLQKMTDVAQGSHLVITSVTPEPMKPQGDYLVSDVEVRGRGRSADFVRFLDELAQKNPYQALVACSIEKRKNNPDGLCDVSWTVRLYFLPETIARGGAATP